MKEEHITKQVEIFCCYARKDSQILHNLYTHLISLERAGLITVWSDENINAGDSWEQALNVHINTTHIFLLLISPDFMVSEFCYSKAMFKILQLHENREAYVIPIILRPTYWKGAPFEKLQVLPTNAKALTSSGWSSEDEALFNVVEGIQVVIEELKATFNPSLPITDYKSTISTQAPTHIYQLYEVFVKSGVPNITFVERNDFTRLKLALAQPGRGVVIEGPSGVGKTTSLKKAIESLTSNQLPLRRALSVDTPVSMLSARKPDHQKKLQTLADWHNGIVIIDDFHRLSPPLREEVVDYLKYLADTEPDTKKLVIVGIPQSSQILVDISYDVATRIDVFKWGKVKDELILQMIDKGEKALNIEIERRSEIVLASNGSLNVAQFLCFNICQREEVLMTQDQPRLIQPNISEAISEVIDDLSRKFREPIRRFAALGGYRDSTCFELLEELARSDNGVLSLLVLKDKRPYLVRGLEQFIQQNWMDKLCKEYPHFLNLLFFDPTIQALVIDDPQFAFYLSKTQFSILRREVGKTSTSTREQIFISYSHQDKEWLDKFLIMLKPLERQGLIKTWSDTMIKPGTQWREEINKALTEAKAAILLVTPNFLASDFIIDGELPPLLEAARGEGLTILWVAVSYSMYAETEIAAYQSANDPAKPLDSLTSSQVNRELVLIAQRIKEIVGTP